MTFPPRDSPLHANEENKAMDVTDDNPAGVLAKALTRVSMEERQEAFYDVHAVSNLVEETEELVTDRLQKFAEELQKIPDKDAFERALQMDREYVCDKNRQMMFLRSGSYDPADGAGRMVRHFQQKLELFGTDKLARDITIEDFKGPDLQCLESGMCQFLTEKDRAGRGVIFRNPMLANDFQPPSRLRVQFFMALKAAEDVEVQKRGVVIIFYRTKGPLYAERIPAMLAQFVESMPVKISAMHMGFDNESNFSTKLSAFMKRLNSNATTARIKIHEISGSHVEMQYNLKSFGIPVKVLPLDMDGNPIMEYHQQWMQRQRALEGGTAAVDNIVEPETAPSSSSMATATTGSTSITFHDNDVLLGRDKVSQSHSGNYRFQYMIEEHWDEYDKSSKVEKTALATKIVDLVKQEGRFLKFNDETNGWEEIDDKTARVKVSMAFRSKRRSYGLSTKRRQSNESESFSDSSSHNKRPKAKNGREHQQAGVEWKTDTCT